LAIWVPTPTLRRGVIRNATCNSADTYILKSRSDDADWNHLVSIGKITVAEPAF